MATQRDLTQHEPEMLREAATLRGARPLSLAFAQRIGQILLEAGDGVVAVG